MVTNALGPDSSPSAARKWGWAKYGDGEIYRGMGFAQFVEAVASIPVDEANPHFRPQAAASLDPNGSLMPDFVGRFEHLERDFWEVAGRLVIKRTRLPHLTRSGADGYSRHYDGRLARLVGNATRPTRKASTSLLSMSP